MTKAPQAGNSKTRLVPPLAPEQAAKLSACFLRDTCENIAAVSMNGTAAGVAVYTPVGSEAFFEGLVPPSFRFISQRGSLFGDRLFHATEDLISAEYDSLCLIDSDSPTLPAEFLRAAVRALAQPGDRLVLGPANDGGYYLIGLKKRHRHVFENVDWSTSRVLTQTIARAKEIKLPVTLLPAWYDVDDGPSLRQLCKELFVTNGRSEGYRASHTRAYLSQLLQFDAGLRIRTDVIEYDQVTAGGSRRCDPALD